MTERPYLLVPGMPGCPHYDTQIIAYRSPTMDCKVWSCPTCHRIVRQDIPAYGVDGWSMPEALVVTGQLGRPIPGTGRRGWGMPDA